MKYHLFIGRYQSPHKGHMHLFDRYLSRNEPVLIAVRDVPVDADNPLTAETVKTLWETIYQNQPLVKVMVIPDIASVNYGREVGYAVNQLQVEENLAAISASEIRRQIDEGMEDWKAMVDASIHELLAARLMAARHSTGAILQFNGSESATH